MTDSRFIKSIKDFIHGLICIDSKSFVPCSVAMVAIITIVYSSMAIHNDAPSLKLLVAPVPQYVLVMERITFGLLSVIALWGLIKKEPIACWVWLLYVAINVLSSTIYSIVTNLNKILSRDYTTANVQYLIISSLVTFLFIWCWIDSLKASLRTRTYFNNRQEVQRNVIYAPTYPDIIEITINRNRRDNT